MAARTQSREVAAVERSYARQLPLRWASQYLPAISEVTGEAPEASRPSDRYSKKLQRRVVAHGRGAISLTAFALMHPNLFEFHEEHILIPRPHPHAISEHPNYRGLRLPGTRGTIQLAQDLGVLRQHPKVWKPAEGWSAPFSPETGRDGDSEGEWLPAPWIGDALLYMYDSVGPYVVPWDFKSREGDHGKASPWKRGRGRKCAERAAEARELVYQAYMSEWQARIVRLAHDTALPIDFERNINMLFRRHAIPLRLAREVIADLIEEFARCIVQGDAAMKVIHKYGCKGVDRAEAKLVFEQAIWDRKLRVDLFEPVATDILVGPELKDPFVVFAEWFNRP